MYDVILILLVALASLVAGAAWVWRVVGRAIDEFEDER